MMRRPPDQGRHGAQQRKYLWAFAFFLLPWLQLAEAQQQQQQQQQPIAAPIIAGGSRQDGGGGRSRKESPLEGDRVLSNPAATAFTQEVIETPHIQRKNTYSVVHTDDDNNNTKNKKRNSENILIPDDASAIATLAPGQSVRAPPARLQSLPSSVGAGVSTPHIARSLEDWEVEDFVLLATIDGDLYASDRRTGKERWRLQVEQPMVETIHHRANVSVLDDDYHPIDHYIWAVEPTKDGSLYLWIPESATGLVRTSFTMKKLVEDLTPFSDGDPPVMYTGDKRTTMVTLDAATGRVLRWFGSGGSQVNEQDSCLRPNALIDPDSAECSNSGTITLGRTEYTVGIAYKDTRPIATLKFSEWGPNNFDNDLLLQYHSTMDNRYITSRHDGKLYGFNYERHARNAKPYFAEDFTSPVVRVFDVARPWGAPPESNPELIILPQPPPPDKDDTLGHLRSSSIFLNQTQNGSWYAMSGRAYPLIIDAPEAQLNQRDWFDLQQSWDMMNEAQISKALVGTHSLGNAWRGIKQQPPTLPPGTLTPPISEDPDNNSAVPTLPTAEPEPPTIIDKVKTLPQIAADSIVDFVKNPVMIILFVSFFFWYRKELGKWAKSKSKHLFLEPVPEGSFVSEREALNTEDAPAEKPSEKSAEVVEESGQTEKTEQLNEDSSDKETTRSVTFDESVLVGEGKTNDQVDGVTPAKKKTHRGRRGGVRHRKGKNKREDSQSRDDDPVIVTVEEAVNKAKKLGEQPRGPEPDIITVPNDVEEVSGPILKMGSLEVNEDQQLGTGSNGTVVFAGKWDGREVAVKRMLIQFYDIASQETRLLRESDDHPNVIRYFAQQQRNAFLYIALELCQASLADIVEKPHIFRDLAQAGERDLPGVLYQITNGLNHLHSLRIVHRDLKPQNILVNMDKHGRPRLLVSDFGLCKKLEGGQSSFGATTAHAAGTSGWRAPELLLDDDARDSGTMIDAGSSTHSGTGSNLVSSDLMPNRRATRAIDIFSLGLVFYYVLTKGSHPFDCGDRYMREVNIRKGNYNLRMLDVLGDYAFEAQDLISAMLNAEPRRRPNAKDVMAHPFFWSAKKRLSFLCDVSDHFEKEPRDPPSPALQELERHASETIRGDFLKQLPKDFVDSLGKQRKYTGSRLLDLLRALRNKRNHYEDMPDSLKKTVGPLPEGYLGFWTRKFPNLLIVCWNVVYEVRWEETDRFREYYEPANL
ncbi:putative serine threonine kinase irei protein [Phaeoacremonium minimum UCRPA7]|uniref:non-specific serine/threonine protein kinase n=1 Tax=Phaeoacremonium minimum (strain UCR-PA7) TaxID=1286976 RepID=R8BB56_PHAM7|nr:putative serine threonine kinase irei protein [Phaeoacremonium minimum UCRPA7]EON96531.1 putative serine threonine kinase irei protein [Phaeoacremonium minimum UCRPA7]